VRRWYLIALLASSISAGVTGLAACGAAGGEYVQGDRSGGANRGETNGRTLDFVSNRPEGDAWEIRIRGNSLFGSYGDSDGNIKKLSTVALDRKETDKVWRLIDALEIPERKQGKKDEDSGFVILKLREPAGDDEKHDDFTVYISRDADEEEELEKLALYLQDLIKKYHKVEAEF
jgi:hypothetical protein